MSSHSVFTKGAMLYLSDEDSEALEHFAKERCAPGASVSAIIHELLVRYHAHDMAIWDQEIAQDVESGAVKVIMHSIDGRNLSGL